MTGGLRAKEHLLAKSGWTPIRVVCLGLNGGKRHVRDRWQSPDGTLVLPAPEAFKQVSQPAPKNRDYRRPRIRRPRFSAARLMAAVMGAVQNR